MNPLLALLPFMHFAQAQVNCDQGNTSCSTGLPMIGSGANGINDVTLILQLVFGIIGAVAMITIIIAGLQFVTSQGDPQGINRARNTIIYAAIGLVVAISAEAIVTFVLGRL